MIAEDADLQQWTAQQFDQLTAALVGIPEREPESAGEIQRESMTLHSRAAFSKRVAELNWTAEVRRFQTDHETQASALFTLSDDWEAAWSQTRGAEVSAAVIKDPLRLLPKVLWELWKALQQGGQPRLAAPKSFWSHPLGVAFAPFRVLDACNQAADATDCIEMRKYTNTNINICTYTYMHTSIHPCIHRYIHTYIHTCIHRYYIYVCIYIHICVAGSFMYNVNQLAVAHKHGKIIHNTRNNCLDALSSPLDTSRKYHCGIRPRKMVLVLTLVGSVPDG